jgi:DedD protein
MNERARYRVTGSIFLIALAVIFLPMVFDGAGAPLRTTPSLPPSQPISQPVPDFADLVPTSDVVQRVEDLREEVDESGFATDTGTRFGEPVLQAADPATQIWAVQAASFANQDNARSFRQELRNSGYEAFISTVNGRSGTLFRVAVGPLLSQADANQMQTDIARKFDVQPSVVEMIP